MSRQDPLMTKAYAKYKADQKEKKYGKQFAYCEGLTEKQLRDELYHRTGDEAVLDMTKQELCETFFEAGRLDELLYFAKPASKRQQAEKPFPFDKMLRSKRRS